MIPACLARINTDGTTDLSLEVGAGANAAVRCVAIQANGNIVFGGEMSEIDNLPQLRIVVRGPEGEILANGNIGADGDVYAAVTSADGKTLIGGAFQHIGGEVRNRIARLTSTQVIEPGYNPSSSGPIYALANQEDGKTLIGGSYATLGPASRANFARLLNDDAISSVTVQSATTVFWERAGSTPDTEQVEFELSTDGGTSYSPLGAGVSVTGGWQITGLSLSGSGIIKARAYTPSASSQGIVEETQSFDFVPEIQVEQPEATILEDAVSTITYPTTQVGGTASLTFYIRNIGLDDLTLTTPTQVALSGTNAGEWSILAQPSTPIAPNGVSTFVLTFDPSTAGGKSAVLTILSDDSDEGTFTINLAGTATPGPGSYDDTFQPVANNAIYTAVLDTLNKVSVGGIFTTLNSLTRNRFGRLTTTGTTDGTLSGSAANNLVSCIAVQPDGSFLVGGTFTSFNGTTRNRIARISATGTLDTTFNPNANNTVNGIEVQSDGKIMVTGSFSTIGGVARQGVARLLSTGAVDTSFVPVGLVGGSFSGSITQPDGLVLANRSVAIYRFLANGAVDATYGSVNGVSFSGTGSALCMALQNDGKLVVGGSFTTIGGVSKSYLARINADGTIDTGFTATLNGFVRGVSVQTDGSLLIIGQFTTINGNAHVSVGRLLSTGLEDTSFVTAVASGSVVGLSGQEDGKPLIMGDFAITSVGSSVKLARLISDPASESLSVLSESSVQWLRSGASPEVSRVLFQLSQDSGTTWSTLGSGARVTGGWGLSSISLPVSGLLRALGFSPTGYFTGSQSLFESQISFSGLSAPDIQVEQPINTVIAEGNQRVFPGRLPTQSVTLTFTLRNTGNATLSGLSVSSANTAEFQILSLSATSIPAGGTATFDIRFSPVSVGFKFSSILIASNVPGVKNPYTFNVVGNGIAAPLVTTLTAQSVTSTTAVLRGSFTARDDAAYAYFQYRIGSSGAWVTAPVTPLTLSGFSAQTLTQGLTGLTPSTSYQYRGVIYNSVTGSASPVNGSIMTFTTPFS